MPESKKKKKTCQYEFKDYKCSRELYDEKHCIFHSMDKKGKKEKFTKAFLEKYESQKMNDDLIYTGFVFPAGAKLWNVKFQRGDLKGVDLKGANLRGANLRGVDLKRAVLTEADLTEADLTGANLQKADLRGASFEKAIVNGVKYSRPTKCRGINVTQATGSPAFVRFAKDQDFLEELRSTKWGNIKYHVWNIIADCGRSMFRWMFLSSLLAFLFATKYILAYGDNPKSFIFATQPESIITFFYYSVVTFTTLGFGDVVPATESLKIWVMIEVIVGYMMLGGLISIFANKLARRS
jgi:hypothetical protein